jgi:hypothetical protein
MATSLCELLDRGIVVQAHEAVAIVQQLINDVASRGASLPAGPPSVTSIYLENDGQAIGAGCDVTPEAATLLQAMLPAGAGQVPGALRYTIARGLLEVVAPPFDSIGDFSRALERFERGDRRAAVRSFLSRVPAPAPVVAAPVVVPEVAVAAPLDLDLDLMRPPPAALPPSHEGQSLSRLWAVAAVLVGAVALAFVANVAGIGAFRPLVVWVPRTVPDTVTGTVPGTVSGTTGSEVPGTVSGTVSGRVPGTVSGTLPGTLPGTVRGTVPGTDPPPWAGPVDSRRSPDDDEKIVSAVDAQQRPVFSPAFASNGSAMFFHTGSTNDERSALATVQAPFDSGSDLRVMTIVDDGARNYHVQPSPDGRFVAFDSDRDGERGVYVANRDGSAVRRISGPGYAAVPTWSPDGRRLAYIRAEPDRPRVWNLWVQALDNGEATRLTQHRFGQTWNASWFPDNRRICYTHEDRVVLMDLETGRIWSFGSPVKGHLVRTPAVSPDGTKVIFQVARDGAWILDLSDRSMRRVLADPTAEEFAWAPDGRRVAFHSRRDGQWGIYILHHG